MWIYLSNDLICIWSIVSAGDIHWVQVDWVGPQTLRRYTHTYTHLNLILILKATLKCYHCFLNVILFLQVWSSISIRHQFMETCRFLRRLSCATDRWAGWLLHPDRPPSLGDPGHAPWPLHQSQTGDSGALHLLHQGDWLIAAVLVAVVTCSLIYLKLTVAGCSVVGVNLILES